MDEQLSERKEIRALCPWMSQNLSEKVKHEHANSDKINKQLMIMLTSFLSSVMSTRCQCDDVLQHRPTLYSIKLTSSMSVVLMYIRSISSD